MPTRDRNDPGYVLHIGDKPYSSWSLRGWLLLRAFGLRFTERLHPMYDPAFDACKAENAPARTVPMLAFSEGGCAVRVWDALAIAETLAERHPNAVHWPRDPAQRAAARVVDEMMAGRRPAVWISDRYSAQQRHGARRQTCLAHLARDTAFALEHGSGDLPFRFKLWLGRAFALAETIASVAISTLATRKRGLEKQLDALLGAPTGCDLAQKLQARIGRVQDQRLTFCDYPGEVGVTNNTSERKLRPCVIQD